MALASPTLNGTVERLLKEQATKGSSKFPWTWSYAQEDIPLNEAEQSVFSSFAKDIALQLISNGKNPKQWFGALNNAGLGNSDSEVPVRSSWIARRILYAYNLSSNAKHGFGDLKIGKTVCTIVLFVDFEAYCDKDARVLRLGVPIPLRLALTMPGVACLLRFFVHNVVHQNEYLHFCGFTGTGRYSDHVLKHLSPKCYHDGAGQTVARDRFPDCPKLFYYTTGAEGDGSTFIVTLQTKADEGNLLALRREILVYLDEIPHEVAKQCGLRTAMVQAAEQEAHELYSNLDIAIVSSSLNSSSSSSSAQEQRPQPQNLEDYREDIHRLEAELVDLKAAEAAKEVAAKAEAKEAAGSEDQNDQDAQNDQDQDDDVVLPATLEYEAQEEVKDELEVCLGDSQVLEPSTLPESTLPESLLETQVLEDTQMVDADEVGDATDVEKLAAVVCAPMTLVELKMPECRSTSSSSSGSGSSSASSRKRGEEDEPEAPMAKRAREDIAREDVGEVPDWQHMMLLINQRTTFQDVYDVASLAVKQGLRLYYEFQKKSQNQAIVRTIAESMANERGDWSNKWTLAVEEQQTTQQKQQEHNDELRRILESQRRDLATAKEASIQQAQTVAEQARLMGEQKELLDAQGRLLQSLQQEIQAIKEQAAQAEAKIERAQQKSEQALQPAALEVVSAGVVRAEHRLEELSQTVSGILTGEGVKQKVLETVKPFLLGTENVRSQLQVNHAFIQNEVLPIVGVCSEKVESCSEKIAALENSVKSIEGLMKKDTGFMAGLGLPCNNSSDSFERRQNLGRGLNLQMDFETEDFDFGGQSPLVNSSDLGFKDFGPQHT
jgi:hypothetical protein